MHSPTNRGSSNTVNQTAWICVLIVAALGLLTLIPKGTLFTKRVQIPHDRTDAEHYLGKIWLASTEDGRCRVIAFDNRSELFWDKGLLPCNPLSAQEQVGRLGSISKSFKGQ